MKKITAEAFDRYMALTEARMAKDLADPNGFLWVDRQPEIRREQLLAELEKGQVIVESQETLEDGKRIAIPSGMVHHWIATIFIPGVHLHQVLELVQDYAHHKDIYKPDVQRSQLLSRNGQNFKIYLRLRRKTIVTVVYNTEFEVCYYEVDDKHEYSQMRSTRIAEVEHPGERNEREKPVGNDHGYLWRLNMYTNYEERDGGVYMQIEFVALSRSVPAIFAWLINPYIKSIPREYLAGLLQKTRQEVEARIAHAD